MPCSLGLGSSFLPVKGLSASSAGSTPLAQFPLRVSVLEVCLLFHSIMASQFIRLPLRYRTSIRSPQTGLCGSSFSTSQQAANQWNHIGQCVSCDRAVCRLMPRDRAAGGLISSQRREVRRLLALRIHGVHCHGRLQVVAVMEGWVVWAVVVELVA